MCGGEKQAQEGDHANDTEPVFQLFLLLSLEKTRASLETDRGRRRRTAREGRTRAGHIYDKDDVGVLLYVFFGFSTTTTTD